MSTIEMTIEYIPHPSRDHNLLQMPVHASRSIDMLGSLHHHHTHCYLHPSCSQLTLGLTVVQVDQSNSHKQYHNKYS